MGEGGRKAAASQGTAEIHQKLGRHRRESPPAGFRGRMALANTSIVDDQPPGLRDNHLFLFQAIQFVILS